LYTVDVFIDIPYADKESILLIIYSILAYSKKILSIVDVVLNLSTISFSK